MVLEATVLCVDNSDWMRNGDYNPTRVEAQQDAVNLLCGAKTQSNPENTIAIVTGGGRSPEVLVTLTPDLGKVLTALHGVRLGGQLDVVSTLQVAQLALKHRQNKNQQQRVIFFIGSPVRADKDELVRLAKRLKKNNVAVDIVNFGEEAENTEKLDAFISAVNSNDNSHLVTIPSGPHILSDLLVSSPIITGGGEGGEAQAGGEYSGGVDPNMDPELALALKISMEEERARQEADAKRKGEEASTQEQKPAAEQPTKEVEMSEAPEDEEDLAQALQMSMQGSEAPKQQAQPAEAQVPDVDMDEDQEMQMALQMSMLQEQAQAAPASTPTEEETSTDEINRVMEDPNFVNSVLLSLPGVDPNDDRIKDVLKSFEKGGDKDKDKK